MLLSRLSKVICHLLYHLWDFIRALSLSMYCTESSLSKKICGLECDCAWASIEKARRRDRVIRAFKLDIHLSDLQNEHRYACLLEKCDKYLRQYDQLERLRRTWENINNEYTDIKCNQDPLPNDIKEKYKEIERKSGQDAATWAIRIKQLQQRQRHLFLTENFSPTAVSTDVATKEGFLSTLDTAVNLKAGKDLLDDRIALLEVMQ